MNGGADLGGMQGFGRIAHEPNEPNFHTEWEARAMAIVVALGACGKWNIDQSRYARESLPPADYLNFPYYKIWTLAAEKLLIERGMVTAEELRAATALTAPVETNGTMHAETAWEMLHSLGGAANRDAERDAAFTVGDTVRAINIHPVGHTRLPRYARGRTGTISQVLGFHVFPDSSGNGKGEDPQWLYQITFTAQELWGHEASAIDRVTIDLWEPHLERAG